MEVVVETQSSNSETRVPGNLKESNNGSGSNSSNENSNSSSSIIPERKLSNADKPGPSRYHF